MGDFYITVQSDSSPNHYPTNTITTFRNHFATPVILNDPYQVALVECSYFHSSTLINKGELLGVWKDGIYQIEYHSQRDITSEGDLLAMFKEDFQLEIKIVDDILIECSVKDVPNFMGKNDTLMIKYLEHWTKQKEPKLEINWCSKIRAILGWDDQKQIYMHPISINSGQTNLYIYSDIVELQRVGGSLAPLLRKVPYKGFHMEHISHDFKHLHYLDISKSEFENILMYIRTESGGPPPLQVGSFSATLHFRPKSY